MPGRTVDAEIGRRLAGSVDLCAHPAVGRLQGAIGQTGPITANRFVENIGPRGIDLVIDLLGRLDVQPLVIGSEAGLSAQIEREVHTEPGIDWRRVDELTEGRRPRQTVIACLLYTSPSPRD